MLHERNSVKCARERFALAARVAELGPLRHQSKCSVISWTCIMGTQIFFFVSRSLHDEHYIILNKLLLLQFPQGQEKFSTSWFHKEA